MNSIIHEVEDQLTLVFVLIVLFVVLVFFPKALDNLEIPDEY